MLPIMAHAQIEDVRAAFDARHLVAYVVAAFLISVFVMMFYNRIYYFREKQVSNETKRINDQLAMILESSKTQTWTYNVNKKPSPDSRNTDKRKPFIFPSISRNFTIATISKICARSYKTSAIGNRVSAH